MKNLRIHKYKHLIITFDFSIKKNDEQPKLAEESFSIKTKYDKLYSNSDKTKSANFWDEVILTETGQAIKTLKRF